MPMVATRAAVAQERKMMRRPRGARCPVRRPIPTRAPAMFAGPYPYSVDDPEFGNWFKSIKKAISIKNVKKVVKKAAPVALAVATGGASAGIAAAVTKVASSLIKKPAAQEIVESAVQATQSGGVSGLLKHSLNLAQQRIAERLQPASYQSIPQGTALQPDTTAGNIAAVPYVPGLTSTNNLPSAYPVPVGMQPMQTAGAGGFGGIPLPVLIGGGVLLAVMLTRRR